MLAVESLVLNQVMLLGQSQIQLMVISQQFEDIRGKLLTDLQASFAFCPLWLGAVSGKGTIRGVDEKLLESRYFCECKYYQKCQKCCFEYFLITANSIVYAGFSYLKNNCACSRDNSPYRGRRSILLRVCCPYKVNFTAPAICYNRR